VLFTSLIFMSGRPQILTQSASEATTRPKRCWTVPFPRNARFVGRESQLERVESILFVEDQPSKVAITGLGGVGKTQVVLELAYRTRERYPECSIFWLPATNAESLQQAYLEAGRLLELSGLEEERVDVKKLVQRYLSQESAGRWLLIFDNADDIDIWTNKVGNENGFSALKEYLPRSSQGRIVFTTRSRKIAVKLAQQNVVSVSEMDEDMGRRLLIRSLINPDLVTNDRDTRELLRQLTSLPLAIVQAAAYINENEITFSNYLSLLKGQEQDVIDLLSEDFEDEGRYQEVKNPIATTWLISFEQIQRLDPLAAEYLSFMCCIDPRDIPQSLLPPMLSRKKETDAIGTLSAYSFVSRRSADDFFDLHRLVHLATRNWLRREESLAQWTLKAVTRLDEVFPNAHHKNRSLWRAYLPHACYILESSLINNEYPERIKLLWKYGQCLYSDGRYTEAEGPISQVIETRKRVLGEEYPDTLISMGKLASTYRNQGRWKEAEELEMQVMETSKKVLGKEHPDTLTSIASLASTYWNQGRWKEAEKLEVQVMETRKRMLGEKHRHTLTSIANLASTYGNQGRWKEAEELEVQVMEMSKRIRGEEHPRTLTSIANLASTYRNQGRWKEAEELEVQVMETTRRVLGAEHPDTLSSIANLASTYGNQGRWKEAEELEVQVMEMSKRVRGEEHPRTLTSIANLASTYRNQGRWKEAEELNVQVMETTRRVLGAEHPNTLRSMANLAFTWKSQGRDIEAVGLMSECHRLRKQKLGPDHPYTISSFETLKEWETGTSEINS
jgi:tetratricopeptide (TPR) repeat protein